MDESTREKAVDVRLGNKKEQRDSGKIMRGDFGGDWEFLHHPVGVLVIGGYYLWGVNRKM